MTQCHLLTPTDRLRRSLRVFVWSSKEPCSKGSYCDARVLLDEVPIVYGEPDENGRRSIGNREDTAAFKDDPRWPTHCRHCGKEFPADAERQVFGEQIYIRDTGEEVTLRDAKPGDMWDAWWMGNFHKGPDGKHLIVVCPDGRQWMIDGRASNCTMKDDNEHKCWVRHGEPPNLTVDKNGHTCAAGAGSIDTGSWHGFLRNGAFVKC